MLIGQPGDAKAVLLRTFDNAPPVHVHGDVCMPDLFQCRIEFSMPRPHLNVRSKVALQMPVIDSHDEPAFQVRGDLINPGKCSVIECLIGTLALN